MKFTLIVIIAFLFGAVLCENEDSIDEYKEKILESLAVWREKVEGATLEALSVLIEDVHNAKEDVLKDAAEALGQLLDLPYESVDIISKVAERALQTSDHEVHVIVSNLAKRAVRKLVSSPLGHFIEQTKRKLEEKPETLLGILTSEE